MEQQTRVVILGGGTAGWMSACLLSKYWHKNASPVEITLIESPDVKTVGVGEGSTPVLRRFFKTLGIQEKDWMLACSATYKCGINFSGWTNKKGVDSFFHPFFSELDPEINNFFFHSCDARRKGNAIMSHPDHFFVSAELARQKKSPILDRRYHRNIKHDYAYHFDAARLADYLKKFAVGLGVRYVEDTVTSVNQSDFGHITALKTEKHDLISGDLFFDCSGFTSLLMEKTLQEPLLSYENSLFNDRAVAISTPRDQAGEFRYSSETLSHAAKAGWVWKIPLRHRFGNGYVYSSKHLSEDEAEKELRLLLGKDAESVEAKHLKMRLGRVSKHWKKNCVAVGLSQGFIEPLEATAIYLIQATIEYFIFYYKRGGFSDSYQDEFNKVINQAFDKTKDFVAAHYLLSSCEKGEYWYDCRKNTAVSDELQNLIEAWDEAKSLDSLLEQNENSMVYRKPSWYCIFSGMERFPPIAHGAPVTATASRRALEHCIRAAENFLPHNGHDHSAYSY